MNLQSTNSPRLGFANQFIVFRLNETRFAVEINQALRIIRLTPITRVPHAPNFLEGVINYKGQAIPIIDLHKRMTLPAGEYGDNARIIIIGLGEQIIGMMVDVVQKIIHLHLDQIQPPPEMVAQVNGVYLTGVAHYNDELIVILDLSRVLSVEEIEEMDAWNAEN